MSTTAAAFINYFVKNTSAAVNRDEILEKINICQNQLLGMDVEIMRILPDPFFKTVLDTYAYTVTDSLIDATTRLPLTGVDVRCIKTPYSRKWNYDAWIATASLLNSLRTPLRFVQDDLGGYVEAPVTSPESTGPSSADCMAYWDDQYNPQDTEDRWRVRVYKWPNQVLVETDLLSIPDDFVYNLLFWKVSELVETTGYGSAPVPLEMVERTLKKFNTKYSASTIYFRPRNSPAINC